MKVFVTASLLLLHQAAFAAELGRLFHTPEQRKALEAARTSRPASVTVVPKAGRASLEGYVVRSDGLSSVWVDGRVVRMPATAK